MNLGPRRTRTGSCPTETREAGGRSRSPRPRNTSTSRPSRSSHSSKPAIWPRSVRRQRAGVRPGRPQGLSGPQCRERVGQHPRRRAGERRPAGPARRPRRALRGDGQAGVRDLLDRVPRVPGMVAVGAGALHRSGQGPVRGDSRRHRSGRRGRRGTGRRPPGGRGERGLGGLAASAAAGRAAHLARPGGADRGGAGRGTGPPLGAGPVAAADPGSPGHGPSDRRPGPGLLGRRGRGAEGEPGPLRERRRALLQRYLGGRSRGSDPVRQPRPGDHPRSSHRGVGGQPAHRHRRSAGPERPSSTPSSASRRKAPSSSSSPSCGPMAYDGCSRSAPCPAITTPGSSASRASSATRPRRTTSRRRRTSSSPSSPTTSVHRSARSSAWARPSRPTVGSSAPTTSSERASRSAVTPSASPGWPTTSTT